MNTDSFWIYMLECENNAYYTGITDDLQRRLRQHRSGSTLSRYTRSFPPRRLIACWHLTGTRGEALRVEHVIKKMSRSRKVDLIVAPEQLASWVLSITGAELQLEVLHPLPDIPKTDDE